MLQRGEMLAASDGVYTELKNLIVWTKDNGGMGTFYRSRHELIFAFKNGTAPHHNTFELGQHGRYRTNVWQYKGVNTLKTGRLNELSLHPSAHVCEYDPLYCDRIIRRWEHYAKDDAEQVACGIDLHRQPGRSAA